MKRVHVVAAGAVVAVVVAMLVGMATAVIITHQASWQLTHFLHTHSLYGGKLRNKCEFYYIHALVTFCTQLCSSTIEKRHTSRYEIISLLS
jgi:hypothetical protein